MNYTDNTDTAFIQFSSTYKRYTDVMALKYQLQCREFNSQITTNTASQLTQLISVSRQLLNTFH